jgi:signal transduction histidine kinase
MNTNTATVDLIHGLREVLSAVDRLVRGAIRGGEVNDTANKLAGVWEPLYEEVDLVEMNPRFTRATAIEVLAQVVRELDLMKCQLDNHLNALNDDPNITEDYKRIPISEVVEDVVSLFRWKAAAKSIQINTEILDVSIVSVRPLALRRALVNILDNAVKYSFAGGKTHPRFIKCMVRRHSTHGDCKIEVESFGVGIEDVELDRVFERGFRSQYAYDEFREGTGIGLFEAKRIVDGMAGQITFASKEQPGGAFKTVVTIILPAGSQ